MLELSEKNKPFNTIDNAVLILNNDPLFAGNIKDNLFRERIELDGNMPWSRSYVAVTDKDDIHIRHYIEKTYHYRNDKAVRDAMQIVATENEYHPVINWLKSLEWDGIARVRYALPHFLGTSGSDYEYECLKLFMLGAISRVFKPGCKFEYMLCLVGGQRAGKSTFIRFLCM